MSSTRGPDGGTTKPLIYQIRIRGHLGRQWGDRFEELQFTLEDDGETLLTGPVVDQAALHGILRSIRDLGLTLVSVNTVGDGEQDPTQDK